MSACRQFLWCSRPFVASATPLSFTTTLILPRVFLPDGPRAHPHTSLLWQLLKCFDLVQNGSRLFAADNNHGDTSAANGLRVLSTGLVIVCHTMAFLMVVPGISNYQVTVIRSVHFKLLSISCIPPWHS